MNHHALPVFRAPTIRATVPASEGRCLSALEERFPRIAEEICQLWGHPELNQYLYRLGIDERGGRQGFPADVFAEISMLLCVHKDIVPSH